MAHERGGETLAHGHLLGGLAHRIDAQHEARKVERPFVQTRDVGTIDVAQLALEAFVDDLVLLGDGELAGVLIVVLIDEFEESRERRAVLEAQTAAVAQVVHTRELGPNIGLVEVVRMVRVVRDRHGSCFVVPGLRYSCVVSIMRGADSSRRPAMS